MDPSSVRNYVLSTAFAKIILTLSEITLEATEVIHGATKVALATIAASIPPTIEARWRQVQATLTSVPLMEIETPIIDLKRNSIYCLEI